jgi:hypothetical protein
VVQANPCHPLVFFVYVALRLEETYEAHSGYGFFHNIPMVSNWLTKLYQTAHHDHHHTHNQGNFGSFAMDWIFGTMDHYQSIEGFQGYQRLKSSQ